MPPIQKTLNYLPKKFIFGYCYLSKKYKSTINLSSKIYESFYN